jgi:hypothetical protein
MRTFVTSTEDKMTLNATMEALVAKLMTGDVVFMLIDQHRNK